MLFKKFINWLKNVNWLRYVATQEFAFFFPLGVFMVMVLTDVYNPIKWALLGIQILSIYKNYGGTLSA